MTKLVYHQKLPRGGRAREGLREKGQFWTPPWVAKAMVAYALAEGAVSLFDPAVGAGAFFRAARTFSRDIKLRGVELYENALEAAREAGIAQSDLAGVRIGDFLQMPLECCPAIIGNPPYLRHHRISKKKKVFLQNAFLKQSGIKLDGRAGLHVYFLIHALRLLEENGRLAFILPADVCEGVFSSALFTWLTRNYCIDAVITFDASATPFPGVDTNPIVLLVRKAQPASTFKWCLCHREGQDDLVRWVERGLRCGKYNGLEVFQRSVDEGLGTGLSRAPLTKREGYPFSKFARTMRGIATGENDFFFLTRQQISDANLSEEYFVRAVGRTRDVPEEILDKAQLDRLDAAGRPTFLLSLAGHAMPTLPGSLKRYLTRGVRMGLPNRALLRQRKPWYRMESRPVPPILFAYLGRRNTRFIRNCAGVVPLTGFLCVYPLSTSRHFTDSLFGALNDPRTLANLSYVGKSYGGGALKVEPRALERLILPSAVVRAYGLEQFLSAQQVELAL